MQPPGLVGVFYLAPGCQSTEHLLGMPDPYRERIIQRQHTLA